MFILRSSDGHAASTLGGKAHALAVAGAAGLPVPPWFVVSPEAYVRSVPFRAHVRAERDVIDRVDPSEQVLRDVMCALEHLCPNGELVAVRSSAIDEDGAAHAFAGQLDSFLSVPHADVPDRISRVWRSAFSDRIVRYRREHALPPPTSGPAVLIQRMVNADTSGVAFTTDPITGRSDIVVIAAVRGLAAPLVSGEVDGDTYRVDRAGAIVSRAIPGGALAGALDDAPARAVADLARAAAQVFGRPQDVEWAFEAGRLYLLQSRPITALLPSVEAPGALRVWDNSNIIESYSGVTTPLTFSFARTAYEGVYRQFCRIMRVPESTIAAHDDLFGNMLGLIRGRVYYNLLNWYRLLALLPGFAVNRRFMEQMMGVREALPNAVASEAAPTRGERVRDAVRLAAMLGGLAFTFLTLGRRTARFRARLDIALAQPVPALTEQRADEIAASYRRLRAQLLTRWDAPILNDFFAMIFYGALRDLTTRWCRDAHGTLQNDLIAGEGGMISAEPARRVQALAALAAPHDGFTSLLLHASAREIIERAASIPGFVPQYREYLERFGERCADELKLESTTLLDDPLPLLRAIGPLARCGRDAAPATSVRADAASLRKHAEQRVGRVLARRPVRRAVFQWVLSNARARVRDRENLRFERTRVFGRIRRIFLEMGGRLHAVRVLEDPRDVFYLEVDEILGFVEGRAVTTDLKGLVATRRAEFARHAEHPAPDSRFETRGMVHHGNVFRATPHDASADGGTASELKGIGCCPGILRGRVRVVRDPSTAALEPGSILVAERTDPGWIMIFPAAAGLIVERGSLLSHSAIVARELGIPAIVSVPGVTAWLKDGDWVEMNGSTGIVRKVVA